MERPLECLKGLDQDDLAHGDLTGVIVNQVIDAFSRDGYVVAQEALPEAAAGDIRAFVMNGEPLRVGKTYAAFRTINSGPDLRSNMHVGGQPGASR